MKYNIENFNKAYYDLCDEFARRYTGDGEYTDYYLIGENNGMLPGPMEINDRYFSIDDIYTTIINNIPIETLDDYYDYCCDKYSNDEPPGINLINFWKKNK